MVKQPFTTQKRTNWLSVETDTQMRRTREKNIREPLNQVEDVI